MLISQYRSRTGVNSRINYVRDAIVLVETPDDVDRHVGSGRSDGFNAGVVAGAGAGVGCGGPALAP
ncbi:MAG: hypothetical protein HC774_00750 [Sphingomonadales bacterium]|nr:hypothetical protein [Sphingomonadales bacterium]